MPSGGHPCGHSCDCKIRRVQPKVQNRDIVPGFLRVLYHLEKKTCGERGLDAEIGLPLEQEPHLHQHIAAGGDVDAFRMERRKAFRELIGVHELAAFQHPRQKRVGRRGLPGTVATGYDEKSWHISIPKGGQSFANIANCRPHLLLYEYIRYFVLVGFGCVTP